MKVALHFNSNHESFGFDYGTPIKEEVFKSLLNDRALNISSKVFSGDLLFGLFSQDIVSEDRTEFSISTTYKFNPEKYHLIYKNWLYSEENNWKKFQKEKLDKSYNQDIYVVCFESIDLRTANYLYDNLKDYEPFIGAMEVVESNRIHFGLYTNSLIPWARIINMNFYLFYDSLAGDYLPTDELQGYQKLGFKSVQLEDLKLRYTIFDEYTDYEQVRRVSEWKKGFGSFLAFVADDIVSKLSEIAPELGNKLWSALNTFESSETREQYAQVSASCRRSFEYVIDCLYPALKKKKSEGHDLGQGAYLNRLFEHVKQAKNSDTNTNLIKNSAESFYEQAEKLNKLANKGVHSEVLRDEARRCLIRSVLLLDDIVSLQSVPFGRTSNQAEEDLRRFFDSIHKDSDNV